MHKQAKTWILVRGCQYKPGASLSLGQILSKPYEPSLPLLPDGPVPIPETAIERTHQLSVDVGTSSLLNVSFKLWAEIDLLPVKGELGANRETSKSIQWHFDRIDSEIMIPRLDEVKEAMRREEVVSQIRRNKFDFRKRLYMITGVRIARGAKLKQEDSNTIGGNLSLGIDLAALSLAPVTVGPAGEISQKKSENYAFGSSSDFVYAYRVCEIHYRKEIYVAPHSHGETFGNDPGDDSEESSDEEEKETEYEMVVEKLNSSDYTGSGVDATQLFKLEKGEGEMEGHKASLLAVDESSTEDNPDEASEDQDVDNFLVY